MSLKIFTFSKEGKLWTESFARVLWIIITQSIIQLLRSRSKSWD